MVYVATPHQAHKSATLLCLAASNHDESGPETLHLVDALLVNGGTVKPRRQALDIDNFVLLLRLRGAGGNSGERSKTHQRQNDAGQDYKQTD